jgi:hypothetical protein
MMRTATKEAGRHEGLVATSGSAMAWMALPAGLLLWRLLTVSPARLVGDWVVILAIFWWVKLVRPKLAVAPAILLGTTTLLLATYVRGHFPHLAAVWGAMR